MSNKTEEALDLPHGNCIMGDECGNLSALRDHYQARPTFEGDEAEVREEVAKAIYLVHDMNGTEPKDSAHMRAVFGDNAREDFRQYGDRARKAAAAALAVVRALLDAKNAEIARLQEDIAELPTIAWLDGAHRAGKERDEALAALAEADRKNGVLLAEWNEALARAEWAGQALADRDAAIVEAVPLLRLLRSKLSIPDEINALLARLDALLPASEPVSDPLVDVYEQIRESIRGFSAAEFANDLRAALAARGGKVVFGEVDHD